MCCNTTLSVPIGSKLANLGVWLSYPCETSPCCSVLQAERLCSYHIYGLVVVLHSQLYAGVTLLVLPKFDLTQFLSATAKYRVDIHVSHSIFNINIG